MFKNINEVTIDSLKKHATLIHYFGLGFIQIKLGDTYRIHFYTKELPSIIDEAIHNHRYDFTSRILHGELHQRIFVPVDGDTHILEDESCDEKVHADTMAKECSVRQILDERLGAGSVYTIDKDTFHMVESNCAITLLSRKSREKDFAQVIRDKNTGKVCPFSKKISEEELWGVVERILNGVARENRTLDTGSTNRSFTTKL